MAPSEKKSLDHFGEFVTKNIRDNALEHFDILAKGEWKSPSLIPLQEALSKIDPEAISVFRRCLMSSIDGAIHDFLFKLQEQADFENRIQVMVDARNVVELSDGIHGEMFLDDGWFARYSKDGEPPEVY